MGFLSIAFVVTMASGSPGVTYQQPQLAADSGQVVVAFGAGNAEYFARSTDQGRTFSEPVNVFEGGHLALGSHRGPRVAITPAAIAISAVVGEKGGGADRDLLAWRSTDGGPSSK